MTPLTSSCMLTSAPLSSSIFTHSTCPASEAFISAVDPFYNVKCISSWEYHQCQIQYNNTLYRSSTTVQKKVIVQGPTPHTVQQHILLTLKRGKISTVRNTQCSLIPYDVIHLSYPPTPHHTTSLITLLIHCPKNKRTLRVTTQFNNRATTHSQQGLVGVLCLISRPPYSCILY